MMVLITGKMVLQELLHLCSRPRKVVCSEREHRPRTRLTERLLRRTFDGGTGVARTLHALPRTHGTLLDPSKTLLLKRVRSSSRQNPQTCVYIYLFEFFLLHPPKNLFSASTRGS